MNKVSIILPVYNVEKYIDKCLESVCNQTYSNIEIIVVIDGSPDNSIDIAKKWSNKDNRVKVIYQENAGSGIARNNGISNATGKYVMFVDPDDWIEKGMVEKLISEVEKDDVDFLTTGCLNDYYDEDDNLYKSIADNFNDELVTNPDDIHKRYVNLLLEGAAGAPTKKVYKLEIIKENNILFPDLRRSQDIVFNYRYIDCIKSMRIYNSTFYHYRIEGETYEVKIRNDYYKTVCLIYSDIKDLLKKWNVSLDKKTQKEFVKYFYNLIVWQISLGNSSSTMKDIVNNDTVREIFAKSKPADLKQRLLRLLLIMRQYKLINSIISIIKK